LEGKTIKEIKVEFIKDKRFRDELCVKLISEMLEGDCTKISQREVSKKVKRLVDELVYAKLTQSCELAEN